MAHSRIELSGFWVLGLLALAVVSAGLAAAPPAVAAPGDITTVAGTTNGFSGDGGPATSAKLDGPTDVVVDNSGNFYIADLLNYRVRKVDASGTITTVAGTGTSGFSGDGGPATSAELGYPSGVAVDDSGNLYIADNTNHRVRKVDSSGTITTVAGTSSACGFSGDGGPAASAQLCWPWGVAVDDSGNLYIADTQHQRVRKVDGSGTITTVAGTGSPGFSGDGGPATSAQLSSPLGVRVDSAGNLYIADTQNERVRKVDGSGTITTVAGTGPPAECDFSGDGGPATSARFCFPEDVVVDGSGNLYIADVQNNRVRKVDGSGTITTVAGTGTTGFSGDGGPAALAELWYPEGVALDGAGNLYIADTANRRVRMVEAGTAPEPPETTFTAGPSGITNDPTPTFAFSSEPGSTFQCKVDTGPYANCSSPRTTAHLADGPHTFYVRATKDSVTGPPASRAFTVRTAAVSVSGSILVVTAAPGAKDNLEITRPSPSTLRVTDSPNGAYTGSGVHTGAGCTRSGDYTANCDAAGVTRIKVYSRVRIDRVINSTAIRGALRGGVGNDVLIGGSNKDTLFGAPGADVMKGMNGNDNLQARDLTSDTTIDCGGGTADKADLDLLPEDPDAAVTGCETMTRH